MKTPQTRTSIESTTSTDAKTTKRKYVKTTARRGKTLFDHVEESTRMTFANDMYFRGFREGEQAAALEMAKCLDSILKKYGVIATYYPLVEKEIVEL